MGVKVGAETSDWRNWKNEIEMREDCGRNRSGRRQEKDKAREKSQLNLGHLTEII